MMKMDEIASKYAFRRFTIASPLKFCFNFRPVNVMLVARVSSVSKKRATARLHRLPMERNENWIGFIEFAKVELSRRGLHHTEC